MWAPLEDGYLLLVEAEFMKSTFRDTHVPEADATTWISSYSKHVLVYWVELSHTEAIFTRFVGHYKIVLCRSLTYIPYFEMAIVSSGEQEIASMGFMSTELNIIYIFNMSIFKFDTRTAFFTNVPYTNLCSLSRAQKTLLLFIPTEGETLFFKAC